MTVIEQLMVDIKSTGILELLAVITGLTYVLLASQKVRLCWWFAMFSTASYAVLCIHENLYLESSLQLFYFIMAVYGWLEWTKDKKIDLPIVRWPAKYHLFNVVGSTVVSLIMGWLMDNFTDQDQPYLDAFTTVFSLLATFMVAKRVLENWLYWIFIDLGLVVLYSSKGFVLTGIQYFIFTVVAIFAFWSWYKLYKTQEN